jgi:hypothetical protein
MLVLIKHILHFDAGQQPTVSGMRRLYLERLVSFLGRHSSGMFGKPAWKVWVCLVHPKCYFIIIFHTKESLRILNHCM